MTQPAVAGTISRVATNRGDEMNGDEAVSGTGSGERRWALVVAILFGTFMCILAVSVIGVALPAIQSHFNADFAGLQWIAGAYTLCLSALMLTSGPLSDRFGADRAWMFGVVIFLTGAMLCALAPSMGFLIAGRAIQGSGAALVIPGALSVLTHSFPDPLARAKAIGSWSAISNISLIFGPMIGGWLVDVVGWQSVFWLSLPLGVLALGFGLYGMKGAAQDARLVTLDVPGQLLSTLFLGALTFSMITAGKAGWGSVATILPLTISLLALGAFLLAESRAKQPLIPFDLFRDFRFATANIASFIIGFSVYSASIFFSLFLQQVRGWSASETGWRLAPMFAATVLVNLAYGSIARRFNLRPVLVFAYLLLCISMIGMGLMLSPTSTHLEMMPWFIGVGVGLGLAVPATDIAIMGLVPPQRCGVASATMNALRQSGMTLGIAVLGVILETRAVTALSRSLEAAGVNNPHAAATSAIHWRKIPEGLGAAQAGFTSLRADAYSSGYSTIFVVAGLCCLFAAIALAARQRASILFSPKGNYVCSPADLKHEQSNPIQKFEVFD